MEPTIYKPSIYKGAGGIYNGRGVYNDGAGGSVPGVEIGGRVYPTVILPDGKEWIAENLDYKFNVNGSQIPIGQGGSPSTPSAWYYNNNESDYGIDGTYKCGLLYNWYAIDYLESNKENLLPEGWRVPTIDEVRSLVNIIGIFDSAKIKAVNNSITDNYPSNWNGTDDYSFTALPSGYREYGSFDRFGQRWYMWTCTSKSSAYGSSVRIDGNSGYITIGDAFYEKASALSLRLIKD